MKAPEIYRRQAWEHHLRGHHKEVALRRAADGWGVALWVASAVMTLAFALLVLSEPLLWVTHVGGVP